MNQYFYILGLNPTATAAEIKTAYRKLAFQYHPDRNPDNPQAAARFREITEAYHKLIAHRKSPPPKNYSTHQSATPRAEPSYQNTYSAYTYAHAKAEAERKERLNKQTQARVNAMYKGKTIAGYNCPRCNRPMVRRIVSYSGLHGIPFVPLLLNIARCDNCAFLFNRRTRKSVSDTTMQLTSMALGVLGLLLIYLIVINNLDKILY